MGNEQYMMYVLDLFFIYTNGFLHFLSRTFLLFPFSFEVSPDIYKYFCYCFQYSEANEFSFYSFTISWVLFCLSPFLFFHSAFFFFFFFFFFFWLAGGWDDWESFEAF